MKTHFFSVVLLTLLGTSVNAAVLLETEIASGKITHIDTTSITLNNTLHFIPRAERTEKLPFHINEVITLRYIRQNDGTLLYVEAAKGRNSLAPKEKLQSSGKKNQQM